MEKEFDVLVVGYAGYDLAVAPVPNNIMEVDTGTAPEKKGAKKDSEVKKGSASEQGKTGTYREVNDDQMD